jgi:adenine-specific DNA-methyltransferase
MLATTWGIVRQIGVIKYIGSKRVLVPVLGAIAQAVGARSAVDLFAGTTRVAQEFKRRGITVTAADAATYSEVLSQCYIETDAELVDTAALAAIVAELQGLPGERGYFTRTFCEASRYFQPKNGMRVDAIARRLREDYQDSPLFPILMTALMLAADRVDSTAGVQMAYLKQWAPRAHNDLELRMPALLPGSGRALRGDAQQLVGSLDHADLAYIDPPYNQHRYFTNYHVWETLMRGDEPEHYGVACKRIDSRDETTKSAFNRKGSMPSALKDVVLRVRADVVVVSYNDEAWVEADDMMRWLRDAGHEDVRLLAYDSKRYVGAQIGIHNPAGERVGRVSHLRNTEYLFVAGPRERVATAAAAAAEARGSG